MKLVVYLKKVKKGNDNKIVNTLSFDITSQKQADKILASLNSSTIKKHEIKY